jgi:UDP-N-acetylmuramoylalanine--D-glutamate ligase
MVADLSQARSLPGRHNAQNAAFALMAARALGVTSDATIQGLLSFPGLAHRMEQVAALARVRFVNDSTATNADAARQALSSYDRSFWIVSAMLALAGLATLKLR